MERYLDEEGKWAWKFKDNVVVRNKDKTETFVDEAKALINKKKK